jgi:rod shape-determining protein MreD
LWNSRRILALILIFLLFLIQNMLGSFVPLTCAVLLVPAVIFYGLLEGAGFGFVAGLTAGFLLDLLATGPMGIHMAALGVVGAVCGQASSKIFPESVVTWALLPFLAHGFIFFSNQMIFGAAADDGGAGFNGQGDIFSPMNILAALFFSYLTFWFLRKTTRARRRQKHAWKAL